MCKAERVPEKHMLMDGWMITDRQAGSALVSSAMQCRGAEQGCYSSLHCHFPSSKHHSAVRREGESVSLYSSGACWLIRSGLVGTEKSVSTKTSDVYVSIVLLLLQQLTINYSCMLLPIVLFCCNESIL